MVSFTLSPSGLSKLLTGSAWLAVSAVLGQGSMLAAGVLVARTLGVQDYGRFTLMQATLMMLAGVAQLSFAVVIAQQVAKYRDRDPEAASRIAAFCLLFTLATGAMLAGLLAIMHGILARDVFRDPPLSPAIVAVAAILPMVGVAGVQQGLFNGLGRFRAQAWMSLALTPLVVAAPFYGAREYGLLGALGGLACALAGRSLVAQIVLVRVFRQEGLSWTFTIARRQAARLLNLAGPATLAGIAVSLAVWGGQTLLARQDDGDAALGLFNASYMLRAVVIFLPQQLVLALLPMVTGEATSVAAKQLLLRFSVGAVLLFSAAAATAAALLADPLLSLFGPGFAAGQATLVWLLLSAPLEALTMTLYQILQSAGRFWRGFLWVNAPLAVTVLGVGAILVPEELSEGLAMAWLAGWAVALVLTMAAVRTTKVGT